MLTRRQLLSTAIAGSAAFVAGASAAQAFTEQPMPPAVAAQYALGCASTGTGGHDQLIQAARSMLRGEIASGLKLASAEAIVTCPICGCRMVVTASN
jgi:hypothetical protein